jgi:hypothetical protein
MKEVINLRGEVEQVTIDTPVKTVNGVHYLLSDDDTAEIAAREAAWEAGAVVRAVLAEITRLESQITPRRMREALLGADGGWLEAQEALIAIERAKL